MSDHTYQPVADDDGPTQMQVSKADGRVVIMLPEAMQWIGMTPVEAMHIAVALTRHAIDLDASLADGLPDVTGPTVN